MPLTPLDHFMNDLLAWVDDAWFIWAAMPLAILGVIAIVTISKARTRSRNRVPQYRRLGRP